MPYGDWDLRLQTQVEVTRSQMKSYEKGLSALKISTVNGLK